VPPKIAILGWGSLLWESGAKFDRWYRGNPQAECAPQFRSIGSKEMFVVMSDAQLAERLSSIVTSHLDGWTSVASETRMCLSRIVQLLQNNEARSDEWAANLRLVTSHLTGDSIRHLTAAPASRRTSYNLLREDS
jgi:hypothetical protein